MRVSVVTSDVMERSLEGDFNIDLVEEERGRGVDVDCLSSAVFILVVFNEMSSLKSKCTPSLKVTD